MTDTTASIPASPLDASPAAAPKKTKGAPVGPADDTRIAPAPSPASVAKDERIESIHVSKIKVVSNVRVTPFDKKALEGLAATIRADGQLEPAQVRLLDDGTYALTLGHRRHAAVSLNEAKHGGDGMLRCIVRSNIAPDAIPFVQLVENLQREDMSDYDMAVVLADLHVSQKLSSKQLGERIGLSERQTRTYIAVGGAPDWLRSSLTSVDITVKVKNDDGTPKLEEDGSPVTEPRTLPGLSLEKVALIVRHHQDLTNGERQYLGTPGYKPRADKLVRQLVQFTAAHDLSRAALTKRIEGAAGAGGSQSADAEATVVRNEKRPYTITSDVIHLDMKNLSKLTIAERRAMAAELHAVFAKLGPDYFTSVSLQGP